MVHLPVLLVQWTEENNNNNSSSSNNNNNNSNSMGWKCCQPTAVTTIIITITKRSHLTHRCQYAEGEVTPQGKKSELQVTFTLTVYTCIFRMKVCFGSENVGWLKHEKQFENWLHQNTINNAYFAIRCILKYFFW